MIQGNGSGHKSNGLVTASLLIGIVLVICALIVRSTIIQVKGYGNTIAVTGAAFKPITSDFAVWQGEITVSAAELESAYAELKKDLLQVKEFLGNAGFSEGEYEVTNVNISKQYNRERVLTGYNLMQKVVLELDDVDRITKLAGETSSLIEKGVEFNSFPPRYLFTKLDELKLEMIKAATENSLLRAQQLAESTGKKVGAPTSARVGVFQIRPLHSQEVSSYGISDVSSVEKEIVCTVHMSYLIE